MRAYSVDLRERIVRAVADGVPQSVVARTFDVARATVQRYVGQHDATGALAPRPTPGPAHKIGAAAAPALRAQVAAAPDATLAEHAARWAREQGVRLSASTVHRALARLAITRKKRRSTPASRTR
jgi:transposase